MAEPYERQIAVKLRIKDIQEGNYFLEEGWKPNYLLTKKREKVSRVNLMGVILDKESEGALSNLVLDDGSGRIILRSFEAVKGLEKIQVGGTVLVIGRVRLFNENKYISPEILKNIEPGWLKVRALELKETLKEEKKEKAEEISEETLNLADKKITELIRELDKGEGALIEEVKERVQLQNYEELIKKMLESGEIFQNLPGRVKLL